jgi:amidase
MRITGLARVACLLLVLGVEARLDAQAFEVTETSISDLQKAMTEGRVTATALVRSYLTRIHAFDQQGPKLNAMITLNPNAVAEAEALDRERAARGRLRGPLHGIPVIVKDNYSTSDMQTSAGTMALLGFIPAQDAFQVRKLQDAGAVILGKSNMHELASGIVTVGSAFGQTLNPYDTERIPGGSSGGTGAAITASFAAAGMGSDTCGSIRIPSAFNNLVGLRPTKGLSSIAGIVPLSTTQDVAGPLARSVADLAVILDATIGEDPADPATHLQPGQTRPVFSTALQADALRGARIGVFEPLFGSASDDQEMIRLIRTAVADMGAQGAILESIKMPDFSDLINGSSVIDFEFKEDFAAYLAQSPTAPVRTLQEILDKGFYHATLESALKRRAAAKGRESGDYRKALAKRTEVQTAILKLLDDHNLDALAYPTMLRKPARVGESQRGSTCQLSATTGFPAISIPAGFTSDGLPDGMELLGRPYDDAKLVSFAYAFEQATHHRRAPAVTPALGARTMAAAKSWQTAIGSAVGRFSFEPTTNELRYSLDATSIPRDQILSATIHRAPKDQIGPVVFVISNTAFVELFGTWHLSNADREKLMAGELYLEITMRDGRSLRATLF